MNRIEKKIEKYLTEKKPLDEAKRNLYNKEPSEVADMIRDKLDNNTVKEIEKIANGEIDDIDRDLFSKVEHSVNVFLERTGGGDGVGLDSLDKLAKKKLLKPTDKPGVVKLTSTMRMSPEDKKLVVKFLWDVINSV